MLDQSETGCKDMKWVKFSQESVQFQALATIKRFGSIITVLVNLS